MGPSDPVEDSPEHKIKLASVLENLISKVIKPTKLLVQTMALEL